MSYATLREQIKLFCPTLGKLKIAEKLARAGIHIGKTPNEVHFSPPATNEQPRIEPRRK